MTLSSKTSNVLELNSGWIRHLLESNEKSYLSKFAQLSTHTRGREKPEDECLYRTCYQRDRDKILHAKSFRRLKDKTQVYIRKSTDHVRVRLTHTLEVMQVARTIARALRLNEDLVEAISLGHDLGHTPFGHTGEAVLNSLLPGGFRHSIQSLRVVDKLEKNGHGLNLCFEVREGILKHSKTRTGIFSSFGNDFPSTLEAMVVKISDSIAYINHDLDDAIYSGLVKEEQIPEEVFETIGRTNGHRISSMVTDVIEQSMDLPEIKMSDEILNVTNSLRDFLFENVYMKEDNFEEAREARNIISFLFDYYVKHKDALVKDIGRSVDDIPIEVAAADLISSMTDNYASKKYESIRS